MALSNRSDGVSTADTIDVTGPDPVAVGDGADRHGRNAEHPTEIPGVGWKDVAVRVKQESKDDNATLLSAGVAFYSLLALFPGLVAIISIYALIANPQQVQRQVIKPLAAAPTKYVTSSLRSCHRSPRQPAAPPLSLRSSASSPPSGQLRRASAI